jgi:hypothetical protein
MRWTSGFVAVTAVALAWACGDSNGPTAPTPPAPPTLVSIQVGISGNPAPSFEPGQSRQFFALGAMSDGATQDLTNLALWQSSNPVVATVSSGGLVTAAAEGRVNIMATFDSRVGRLEVEVARPAGCRYTLNPPRLIFSAFGGTASVQVTTSSSDCRWRVRSDASWFPYTFDPNRSGNGVFNYTLPGNSTTTAREAEFVILDGGSNAATAHVVEQERPVSCSYVTSPRESRVPLAGGTVTFSVITDPPDCRWTASFSTFSFSLVSPSSGQGATTITVVARPRTFDTSDFIDIRGLSGQNPPGRHRVVWGNPSTPPFIR